MDIYKGTGAFSGIAIGKILYYHKSEYQMRQYEITDVKTELNIFRQARTRVMEQLEDRLNYAKEIGGSYGGIRGPGFCRVRAYRTGSGAGA